MAKKKILLITLLLVLSLFLTACEEADAEILLDLLLDWAHEKALIVCAQPDPAKDIPPPNDDPATCVVETTGALNFWIGGEVAENVAENSGIPLLDTAADFASEILKDESGLDTGTEAMLDTGLVAKDIAQADALAAEGLKNGDPSKYEEAIKKRPNDWAYQEQLWAFYAAQGNQEKMGEVSLISDELVQTQLDAVFTAKDLDADDPEALAVCRNTYLSQYRHREEALHAQFERDQNNPNSDLLAAQLRLASTKVDQVQNDHPSSPCAPLFP